MDSDRQETFAGIGWARLVALLLLVLAGVWPLDAEAQVLTKVGSFLAPTGGPNKSVTGVGFTPKAVIFFWTGQTATGFAAGAHAGYGFATAASNERAVNFLSDDNQAGGGNAKRWQWSLRCIVVTAAGATLAAEGQLSSMDVDGFSLSFPTRGTAWIIHYMAIGGPDVTNAAVGTLTPTPGTGSQNVAVAFQPDFLMFLSVDSNSINSASAITDGKVSIGFAGQSTNKGITQGGTTAVSRANTSPIITSGAQQSTAAMLEKDTGVTTRTFVASVTAFTPTGFTINKTVNTGGTETVVHFLALKGGSYRIGSIARPTAAGPQVQSYTGVGVIPTGLMFLSWNLVEQIYDEDGRISFSAVDSSFNQRATFFHDKIDNPADGDNSFVKQGTSGSDVATGRAVFLAQPGDCPLKFAEPANPTQCSGGPKVISDANVTSFGSDTFTLSWTTNDTAGANQIPGDEAGAQVLYLAMGGAIPPPGIRTHVGSFFSAQFNGNQNVAGVGFQPKAVIFFWTRQDVPNPTWAVGAQVGYGFATGPGSERAVNYLSDDNLDPGLAGGNNTSRWQWTDKCVVLTNTSVTATTSHEATFVSMNADGFTINWTKTPGAGASYIVHYLALGGTDITNAKVGTFRPAASSVPASQSFTGVGFQPDFLMFLSIDSNTAAARVNPHGKVSIGFAANGPSITQGGLTAATRSGPIGNVITSGAVSDDSAILEKAETSANITFEAGVTSFDADGFTINKTINDAGTETDVHYLALRGGQYKVGWFTRPTTDGAQTVSYTGMGFPAKGLLFTSWAHIRSTLDPNVGDSEARISFSAADSTPAGFNQRATFFHDKADIPADGDYTLVRQNTSGTVGLNGKVVFLGQAGSCPPNPLYTDPAGTMQCSGGPRILAEADVASYNADGFTLNWTTSDVTNTSDWIGDERDAQVFYVGFGNESTTEVTLSSFTARGEDSSVSLDWQTASELDNLGFNLYRSLSDSGPWTRITFSLIPGLGASPIGARYSYTDTGLTNGVRYYYELEDVETTGGTERHGPVSATPLAGQTPGEPGEDPGTEPGDGDPTPVESTRISYGDPSTVSLQVLRRDANGVDLELLTGGFYASREADGTMKLEVPGFELQGTPGTPAIPVRRTFLEAVTGRQVRITSVVPADVLSFPWSRPALAGSPELLVGRNGTVKPGIRRVRPAWTSRRPYPAQAARIVTTAFQGETKKALLELAPLRWNSTTGQLLLTRRLRVRVVFNGIAPGETPLGGSRGRLLPRRGVGAPRGLVARLLARDKGVYAVAFDDVFRDQRGAVATSRLRLSRLGRDVAFHVEPDPSRFSPGSVLYFLSEGGSLSAYTNEAVYELAAGTRGTVMSVVSSPPLGDALAQAVAHRAWEQNRYYMSGLLDAPDLWLWDSFPSGTPAKPFVFTVGDLAASSEPATLSVWLQGASDLDASPDHHVRISVNHSFVAEASWDGKTARRVDALLYPGALHEGDNLLEIENVADTPAAYSMVYLDRFSLDYPHTLAAEDGRFEATFASAGSATVAGLGAGSLLLDTTSDAARWVLRSAEGPAGLGFATEAGHRYLAVSPGALLRPAIRWSFSGSGDLRSTRNQADYLLIAPRELVPAAAPLVQLREEQGLRSRAVPLEDVYDAFGYGEKSPEAIRDFIAYAYHHWTAPAPRYVLLLGDATFDPKDYARTGVKDQLPVFVFKSTWLWTASDPAYASINGDDDLPDLAIGRLPAASLEQAQTLVQKLVAFERNGFDPAAGAVLVADNPDRAGDFETDADDIAAGPLAGVPTEKIYLARLGTATTRSEIVSAFDRGASLMSYVGHGGIDVWAAERVLISEDLPKLSPQARQPVLFTMNCLNGYFFAPALDSLAEALVKAEDKGAIAAVSPSGLSLDSAAHVYHKALVAQVASGQHARLGDAILAAQADYATTGIFPELLRVYNLLGDPAMWIW